MSELKPCPCCGGEAVRDSKRGSRGNTLRFVRCTECGLRTTTNPSDNGAEINAWNKRQPLECEAGCPLNIGRPS